MSNNKPVRKSGRVRVPNRLYSPKLLQGSDFGDSEDEYEVGLFREDKNHEDAGGLYEEDEEDNVDFGEEAYEVEDDLQANEDEDEDGEIGPEEVVASDDDHFDQGADELSEGGLDAPIESGDRFIDLPTKSTDRGGTDPWRWAQIVQPLDNNVRGITGRVTHTNKLELLRESYGLDASAVDLAQQRWMRDPTFPHCQGGLFYPAGFDHGLTDRKKEEKATRPYFPPFDETLIGRNSQRHNLTTAHEQVKFLPRHRPSIEFFAGPYNKQARHELPAYGSRSLNAFFPGAENAKEELNVRKAKAGRRKGLLLNTGGRVLSLAWVPRKTDQAQYLAVVVDQSAPSPGTRTPFQPSENYPASVQIWRFPNEKLIDQERQETLGPGEPKLVRVICAEWGSTRRLCWCPGLLVAAPRPGSDTLIGFLGIICTDGCVRVIEVDEPSDSVNSFSYYQTSIFSSRPDDTVCTCLDWISPTDLAVGCANGFVAIWNVSKALSKGSTDTNIPRAWFYHSVSDTFVNTIVSAGPIAPHLLHVISVSGFQRLVDIRNPDTELVESLRSRIYQSSAAYLPHMQSFMSTDENGDLICLMGRRFFNSRRVAPTTAGASGGAVIATSPLHCSVLFATPDGLVSCTSPLIRVLFTRSKSSYSQKWFIHEWRELKPSDESMATEKTVDFDLRHGIVRMTEGYKLEKVPVKFKIKEKYKDRTQQSAFAFEEEQAITALAWNPNLDCGSWAAAGTGSGLLRVEDISVGQS